MFQVENEFRKNPAHVSIYGEVGVNEGILPSPAIGASTKISRSGYFFITGEQAKTKVLAEIEQYSSLPKLFLSCMIRGPI